MKLWRLKCLEYTAGLALFIAIFQTLPATASSSKTHCATLLSPEATLEQINDTIRDLAALRFNLDIAKIKGSSSLVLTRLNADYEQKEQALVAYLEANKIMSREDLLSRMRQEIVAIQSGVQVAQEKKSRHRKDQEEQFNKHVIDGTRLIMHQIEPGDFMMGEVGEQVHVTLTKPFYMAATKTTQIIWRKIAELANSKFGDKYKINVHPSNFKDDTLPVESVSYDNVQVWIGGLNELSQAGEPSLADLIPGQKEGDVYRLPTDAEWEFVVRGRGLYNENYHFGNDESLLGDYAWFDKNSDRRPHPVAQKKPLVIAGKEFYDMHGNVWEWVHDWYGIQVPGGTDPQGPNTGSSRVIRGSSWYNADFYLRSANRRSAGPRDRYDIVGFRLAREAR